VSLRTELPTGLPPVLGDRIQLQQVLLNLVMNGVEALSAVTDRPRELLIRSGTHEPQSIFVALRDSGIGLDPQTVDRIFDAFYTTKPEGMAWDCRSAARSSRRTAAACGPPRTTVRVRRFS
jgi:C4-dicarboxylate-specific signal transduction histidine kinase